MKWRQEPPVRRTKKILHLSSVNIFVSFSSKLGVGKALKIHLQQGKMSYVPVLQTEFELNRSQFSSVCLTSALVMECSAHAKLTPREEPDPTMIIVPLSAHDLTARMKQDHRTNSEPGVRRAPTLNISKPMGMLSPFPSFLYLRRSSCCNETSTLSSVFLTSKMY